MAPPASSLSARAYLLLSGDAEFERLVARVLQRVRRFMAVPADVDDPVVLEELAALRVELERNLPAFRDAYARLLEQHLDAHGLASLIEQLELGGLAGVSASLRALQQSVQAEVVRLEKRMGELPLYGPGALVHV
jgi:hypothetical protein